MKKTTPLILLLIIIATCYSCNNSSKKKDIPTIEVDSGNIQVKYATDIFCIPSPQQTIMLVKKYNLDYINDLINPDKNITNYTTAHKLALNLGVYGTDFGYLSIHNRKQEALNYLTNIKKITQELELTAAVKDAVFKQLENNISNEDSIMGLIATTYKDVDEYLKINNRDIIGNLIIAGGWIESIYIASQSVLESQNPELIRHIADQKTPLYKLIQLLKPYYNQSDQFNKVFDGIIDIAYELDCVDLFYEYHESVTNAEEKTTTITGQSEMRSYNYDFSRLARTIATVRNDIIN